MDHPLSVSDAAQESIVTHPPDVQPTANARSFSIVPSINRLNAAHFSPCPAANPAELSFPITPVIPSEGRCPSTPTICAKFRLNRSISPLSIFRFLFIAPARCGKLFITIFPAAVDEVCFLRLLLFPPGKAEPSPSSIPSHSSEYSPPASSSISARTSRSPETTSAFSFFPGRLVFFTPDAVLLLTALGFRIPPSWILSSRMPCFSVRLSFFVRGGVQAGRGSCGVVAVALEGCGRDVRGLWRARVARLRMEGIARWSAEEGRSGVVL